MRLGKPMVVVCQHCSGTKELVSLLSGNTFRAKVWSDYRAKYPMMPERSPVQRCPHCGRYFFLEDADTVPYEGESPDDRLERMFEEMLGNIFDNME